MKRFELLVALLLPAIALFGQGHTLYSDEDPAFDYIQTYLPEYYYEENAAGGTLVSIAVSVRTLHNYLDDNTFSYYILAHDQVWGCLDIDEIDSIIAYLERSFDKASFPSKTATAVYNTRRGFKFETTLPGQNPHIELSFPKNGPTISIKNPSYVIKYLKKGKEFVKYDTQFVPWNDSPDSHGYYAVKAVAKIKLRSVIGSLPKPKAIVNEKGKVIVQIKVDQYGNVTEAVPGAEGTTIMDKDQWEAARSAAMKTRFNISPTETVSQSGTITYTFDELD